MPPIPASAAQLDAMRAALDEARIAAASGEIPVGAVVLDAAGAIIAREHNRRTAVPDPTAHAEILALRAAAATRGERLLEHCTMVVTLEPCVMCAGAILAARVSRVVFGAWDEKAGAVGSVYDLLRDGRLPHAVPEVVAGVLAEPSAQLLAEFFRARRSSRR